MSTTSTTPALETITAAALARVIAEGRVAELWNALGDDYFRGEMIPGSRRVPFDLVGREVAATNLSRDTAIVVYCSGPACPHSRIAAEKLLAFGFRNVRLFEGGLEAWKAAGYEVEHDTAGATSA